MLGLGLSQKARDGFNQVNTGVYLTMSKAAKKHKPMADQVMEAVEQKGIVIPLEQKEMFSAATQALAIVAAKHAASEPEEAADSDEGEPASQVAETTETLSEATGGPAIDSGVGDLALTLAAGTTDDTRAPQQLDMPAIAPKAPRKPLVNWSKVGSAIKDGAAAFMRGADEATESFIKGVDGLLSLMGITLLAIYALFPYLLGRLIGGTVRAFKNGYNHKFVIVPAAN